MLIKRVSTAALVSLSLCLSATSASAAACQAGPGGQGCVLPVGQAAPLAPPQAAAAPAFQGQPAARGLGILPILAGAAVLALLAVLLTRDRDSPRSP